MRHGLCMKALFASVCLTGFVVSACATEKIPETILLDGRMLAENRLRIHNGDAALMPAFETLVKDAEAALRQGPFSVMDKTRMPPSGDKHDYASYARYWWPDPAKPDGLPYIRRDGETNPETMDSSATDRYRMEEMVKGVESLGLAYYLTGETRYADKAAQLLRTWFIDPETRMNPNLNYSQGIPGIAEGYSAGVIDSRILCRALDGALLIEDSKSLDATEMKALREWSAQYLHWLQTNALPLKEAEAKNNHGTFFDVQAMYFALFASDTEYARGIARASVENRVLKQIKPDGSMPEELSRTRSLHYSIFNTQAMLQLARLAEQVDVDLWHVGDNRIKSALDYVAPYADPERKWPQEDVLEAKRTELLWPLLYAAGIYRDDHYRQLAEKLPEAKRIVDRANLAAPLMH